jgi:hypothetical protein
MKYIYTPDELGAISALMDIYKNKKPYNYICKCGAELKHKRSISIHIKTKRHITWLKKYSPMHNMHCNKTVDVMSFYI